MSLIKTVNTIASNNGWTSDTALQQALNFISSRGLDDAFISTLTARNDTRKVYNLNDAFEEIQDNDDMEYAECTVYHIDAENDPHRPCDEFTILLAVDSAASNGSIAVMAAETHSEICMTNERIVVSCPPENIKRYPSNAIYENENGDKVFISDDHTETTLEECYV